MPPDDRRILDNDYSESVHSELSPDDIENALAVKNANSVAKAVSEVSSNGADILEEVQKWNKVMSVLKVGGPALAAVSTVISLVFSLTEGKSAVEILIEEKFEQLFAQLDDLEEAIGRQFREVKKQIGDQTLDDFTSSLQAISSAYKDLQTATANRDPELSRSIPNLLVKDYSEQFR